MDLAEIGIGDFDWIDVGQDWEKWRALVNAVINILATQLVASRVVLSTIEQVSK
jgi:hypothetical protein